MWDVIVIGGGIGGVTCGAILSKAGKKVLLLEERARVGGRATSVDREGLKIDYGTHLITANGYITRTLRWLGSGLEFHNLDPWAVIVEDGRFTEVPTKIKDYENFEYMSKSERSELLDIFRSIGQMSLEETEEYDSISCWDWMEKHVKSERVKQFLTFIDNLYLTQDDTAQLSQGEAFRLLRRNVRNNAWFCYPKAGGAIAISQEFADVITKGGGKVETRTSVREIVVKDGQVQGVIAEGKEGLIKEEAPVVVCNFPIVKLWKFVDSGLFPDWFTEHIALLERKLREWSIAGIGVTLITSQPLYEYSCVVVIPAWAKENACGPRAVKYVWSPSIFSEVGPKGRHYAAYGNIMSKTYYEFLRKETSVYKNEIEHLEEELLSLFPKFDRNNILEIRKGMVDWCDSNMKFPGNSGNQRVDVEAPSVKGLYFAGDMVKGWGVGTDSAACSGVLCSERILETKLKDLQEP